MPWLTASFLAALTLAPSAGSSAATAEVELPDNYRLDQLSPAELQLHEERIRRTTSAAEFLERSIDLDTTDAGLFVDDEGSIVVQIDDAADLADTKSHVGEHESVVYRLVERDGASLRESVRTLRALTENNILSTCSSRGISLSDFLRQS